MEEPASTVRVSTFIVVGAAEPSLPLNLRIAPFVTLRLENL
jgi:hypothetical protein